MDAIAEDNLMERYMALTDAQRQRIANRYLDVNGLDLFMHLLDPSFSRDFWRTQAMRFIAERLPACGLNGSDAA